MCIPLLLSPRTWLRHKFNTDDIRDLIASYNMRYMWLLGILHRIRIPYSSCSNTDYGSKVVFTGKANVINKLCRQLCQLYRIPSAEHYQSQLTPATRTYTVRLPYIRIPADKYRRMAAAKIPPLSPRYVSEILTIPRHPDDAASDILFGTDSLQPDYFATLDVYPKNMLLLVRIIPAHEQHTIYMSTPIQRCAAADIAIIVNHQTFILVEDAIFCSPQLE